MADIPNGAGGPNTTLRCPVIAEVAQAHDGSLGMAHAYIDAIADAGAHVVKFQTHFAAAESTPAEPWRIKFSPQDATRYDYWKRMEFTHEQWEVHVTFSRECFGPDVSPSLTTAELRQVVEGARFNFHLVGQRPLRSSPGRSSRLVLPYRRPQGAYCLPLRSGRQWLLV